MVGGLVSNDDEARPIKAEVGKKREIWNRKWFDQYYGY